MKLQLSLLGNDNAALLRRFGELAAAENIRAYLAGGAVRDCLLQQTQSMQLPVPDIDVMVDEGLEKFIAAVSGQKLFASPPVKVVRFEKYLTAKLCFQDSETGLDFSQAREETYPSPGAAPLARPGSLRSDMLRRDFGINALACELAPGSFGTVVDLTGGVEDLQRRWIRILHPLSFSDDPVRLLRAVRFKVRLGFTLAPETEVLFREAAAGSFLNTVSRTRLREELRKILQERAAKPILAELHESGLIRQLLPRLNVSPEVFARWDERLQLVESKPDCLLAVLFADTAEEALHDELKAMQYPSRSAASVIECHRRLQNHA